MRGTDVFIHNLHFPSYYWSSLGFIHASKHNDIQFTAFSETFAELEHQHATLWSYNVAALLWGLNNFTQSFYQVEISSPKLHTWIFGHLLAAQVGRIGRGDLLWMLLSEDSPRSLAPSAQARTLVPRGLLLQGQDCLPSWDGAEMRMAVVDRTFHLQW